LILTLPSYYISIHPSSVTIIVIKLVVFTYMSRLLVAIVRKQTKIIKESTIIQ
jgi:hypothetical protein